MKRAWHQINDNDADSLPLLIVGKPYDNENKAMNETILQYAQDRKSPFQGLKAKQHECLTRTVSSYQLSYPRRGDVQHTSRDGNGNEPREPTLEDYWH